MKRSALLFLMIIGFGSACTGIFDSCPPPTYKSVEILDHELFIYNELNTVVENKDSCIKDSIKLYPRWDVEFEMASTNLGFGYQAYALDCYDSYACLNWIESYEVIALSGAADHFEIGDTLNSIMRTVRYEISLNDIWNEGPDRPVQNDPSFFTYYYGSSDGKKGLLYFSQIEFIPEIQLPDSLQVEVHMRTTNGVYSVVTSPLIYFYQ
ncbi:MAG: hypothetical protein HWE14_00420 [Flavobacteriia bacterium]|nr:hypothetical protein [Flavobacteriia bacterium]